MTAGGDVAERRPGRPRDARADETIMRASVEVLADKGPSGFTVDEVAARAGCGKATIYRRWPSRANLLLDTAHRMGLEPDVVDTGSVRDDLVVLMSQLGTKLRETPAGRIMPAVIAEASVNPEMRAVLGAFVRDRRQRPRDVVVRGIERGQVRADTDVDLLLDVLGGTVFYRELVSGEPADEEFVGRLLDVVLAAFT
ncbi:MAG TPA: TetR/AcrR family transcriptional regulator [Acidimicrobiales bacterium]|nr:TetR/AcrR family transcriptional regulator [Acidimicrobiales bacterium]